MYMCICVYVFIQNYLVLQVLLHLWQLLVRLPLENLVPHPLGGKCIGGFAAARGLWPVTESQGLWPLLLVETHGL